MTAPTYLPPQQLEALAELVADKLAARLGVANASRQLVDAATLAAELGVDRSWVYSHQVEMGAKRLGEGRKPRLRFELAVARRVLEDSAVAGVPVRPARATRTRDGSAGRVLAIRPRKAA